MCDFREIIEQRIPTLSSALGDVPVHSDYASDEYIKEKISGDWEFWSPKNDAFSIAHALAKDAGVSSPSLGVVANGNNSVLRIKLADIVAFYSPLGRDATKLTDADAKCLLLLELFGGGMFFWLRGITNTGKYLVDGGVCIGATEPKPIRHADKQNGFWQRPSSVRGLLREIRDVVCAVTEKHRGVCDIFDIPNDLPAYELTHALWPKLLRTMQCYVLLDCAVKISEMASIVRPSRNVEIWGNGILWRNCNSSRGAQNMLTSFNAEAVFVEMQTYGVSKPTISATSMFATFLGKRSMLDVEGDTKDVESAV